MGGIEMYKSSFKKQWLIRFNIFMLLMLMTLSSVVASPVNNVNLEEIKSKIERAAEICQLGIRMTKYSASSSVNIQQDSSPGDWEIDLEVTDVSPGFQIKRMYNQSEASSYSFGQGWVFNFDTRIILGIAPNIEYRYETVSQLAVEMANIYQSLEKIDKNLLDTEMVKQLEQIATYKEELEKSYQQVEDEYQYAEFAHYSNLGNLDWSTQGDWEEIGSNRLIWIDEAGQPHFYTITQVPDYYSDYKNYDGWINYYPQGSNLVPDQSVDPEIRILPDGTYQLKQEDGKIYKYSHYGKLVEIEDSKRKTIKFEYNSHRELTQISDNLNRKVNFEWSQGKVIEIEDFSGETFSYNYDQENLVKFTSPKMEETDYNTLNSASNSLYQQSLITVQSDDCDHNWIGLRKWVEPREYKDSGHKVYDGEKCTICNKRKTWYVEYRPHSKQEDEWKKKDGSSHSRTITCSECYWEDIKTESHNFEYNSSAEADECTVCGYQVPNAAHESTEKSEELVDQGETDYQVAVTNTQEANESIDQSESDKTTAEGQQDVADQGYQNGVGSNQRAVDQTDLSNQNTDGAIGQSDAATTSNGEAEDAYDDSVDAEGSSQDDVDDMKQNHQDGEDTTSDANDLNLDNIAKEGALEDKTNDDTIDENSSITGDPVKYSTGEYVSKSTDVKIDGPEEFDIQIVRFYGNFNQSSHSFGKGWNFNYDTRMIIGVRPDFVEVAESLVMYASNMENNYIQAVANYQSGLVFAKEAISLAEDSVNQAELAVSQAENAQSLAEDAVKYANNAEESSQEAEKVLHEALSALEIAFSEGESAKSLAEEADQKASDAISSAGDTLALANSAISEAKSALSSANGNSTLISEANTALNAAESLKADAKKVESDAKVAASRAKTLVTEISTLLSELNHLKKDIEIANSEATDNKVNATTALANAEEALRLASEMITITKDTLKQAEARLRSSKNWYQQVLDSHVLVEELYQMKEEVQALSAQAQLEREFSEVARYRNQYNVDWNGNPERDEVGIQKLILIDEKGVPHLYRLTTKPDFDTSVSYPDGKKNYYPKGGQGIPDEPTDDQLELLVDGSYILTKKDKSVYYYSYYGKLLKLTGPKGGYLKFAYNADQELTEITDQYGRKIYFQQSNGKITKVIDPIGRVHIYSYSGNRLVGYTDPSGATRRYLYNEHGLSETCYPDGSGWKYFYTKLNGRYVMDYQVDSSGAVFDFEYNLDNNQTIVTNRRGNQTAYYFSDRYLTEQTVKADYNQILKTYDAQDNLISVTNEKGYTTQYTYDQNNNIIAITDPKGQTVAFTYNELNKVTSITERNGNTTYYDYDSKGNLLAIRYPDGTSQSFTHNLLGMVISIRDQLGNLTSYSYDSYGYPTEKIYADGTREQYDYNQVGQLLKVTKPNGGEINYTYNPNGRITSVMDELGFTTSYQYNLRGRISQMIDPNGHVYEYMYDSRNKLVEIIDPEGQSQRFEYDEEENLTKEILAENIHYLYEYDNLDRLVVSTQEETGVTVKYEYNAVGNVIGFIDGEDRKISYSYDELNRKVQEIDQLNQIIYYEYFPNNQLKAITDKRGYTTNFEYDSMRRLTKVTNALGESIQYKYDQMGNLIKFVDAKGLETKFAYDIHNRLTKKINPGGGEIDYEYDLVGNLIKAIDPEDNVTTYEYDAKGRLIKEVNTLGDVKSYEYDPASNIVATIDEAGVKITYGYDKLNRLVEIKNALGYVTKLGYNRLGMIAWQEDAMGNRVEYEYDALGQVTYITDAEGHQVYYTYDKSGNLVSQTDQLGNVTIYKYDDLSRLVQVVDALNNSTKYSYDGNNNVIAMTNGKENVFQYEYDALNRPIAEINYLGVRQSYEYDPNNNLIKKVDFNGNATTYQYDDLNRLLEVTFADDSTKGFAYDQLGNLTRAVNQNSQERFYYDELSRLAKVEVDKFNELGEKDWIIDYTYNAVGQRTKVKVSGPEVSSRETRYQYDELNRLSKVEMPEDESIEFKYDRLNRVIGQINDNKTGTSYTYTPRNQVETIVHWKEQSGFNEVLDSYGYIYNPKGQRVLEVQGGAEVQAYEYDATGRIQKVYYPFEDAKKMEDLKERAYYGLLPAIEEPYEYELNFNPNISWEEQLNFTSQLDETIDDLDITEEFGVIGSLTLSRGMNALPLPDTLGLNHEEYQELDQLFNQIKMPNYGTFNPQGQSYWTEKFNYDANGNVISKQNGWGEIGYQYNQNNQLVQAGNRTYAYDPNGNLINEGMGSFSAEYVYNYENRLIKAINMKYANFYNGDQSFFGEISFAYDALGRKINKTVDPLKKPQVETTHYLYDGLGVNVLAEYQMLGWEHPGQGNGIGNEPSPELPTPGKGNSIGKNNGISVGNGNSSGNGPGNANGVPFRGGKLSKYNEYYYGNGNLLALWHSIDPSQGNGNGVHPNPKIDFRYYHKDVLGSIVMMTGEHAEPVQRYEYDAFGNPYQGHFLHNPNNNNPYGYTGQRYEPELGIYSFAYRDYNPHSMRWMTVDPIMDGLNWYQYVGSNPVNFVDPLGLALEESLLSGITWSELHEYSLQHKEVQIAVAQKVMGAIEVPIKGGGRKGGYGYMDIYNPLDNLVWEVKPDNPSWNEKSGVGREQLDRYIAASMIPSNQTNLGGPIKPGYVIEPFTIPYGEDKEIFIRSGNPSYDPRESGMVYYSVKDKIKQPNEVPVQVPVYEEEKESDLSFWSRVGLVAGGSALVIGTIVEDVLTAGGGILNDIPSLGAGFKMIQSGFGY